jgi:protein-disulfide isomerase
MVKQAQVRVAVLSIGVSLCACGAFASKIKAATSEGQPGDRLEAPELVQSELKLPLDSIEARFDENRRLLQQGGSGRTSLPSARLLIPEQLISLVGAPELGNSSAKLVVVEYSDFYCPYCGKHFMETLPLIKQQFLDTGRIRYVFRNFPIARLHPSAVGAAQAAYCAGRSGKFWEMHNLLFSKRHVLANSSFVDFAPDVGVDRDAFRNCLEGESTETIKREIEEASSVGINVTPTFFVGLDQGGGLMRVRRRISGAQPIPVFRRVIEELEATFR